jgi:uncharacterized protein GlcG (DUF336 family)
MILVHRSIFSNDLQKLNQSGKNVTIAIVAEKGTLANTIKSVK